MADEQLAIVPCDPAWPRRFEDERVVLERVLAPWLEGGIHHVGSTAIPGIAAKPIIDIIAGVRDSKRRARRSIRCANSPTITRLIVRPLHTTSTSRRFARRSKLTAFI
jgi:GrpB-like predicted nucleotidyltransferase (UPF0157 family)